MTDHGIMFSLGWTAGTRKADTDLVSYSWQNRKPVFQHQKPAPTDVNTITTTTATSTACHSHCVCQWSTEEVNSIARLQVKQEWGNNLRGILAWSADNAIQTLAILSPYLAEDCNVDRGLIFVPMNFIRIVGKLDC